MSSPAVAFGISALEHALACLYEGFLLAQPPLSDALRLYAQLAFNPLHPATPTDEIKRRLEGGKTQTHFVEVSAAAAASSAILTASQAGPWDIFIIFEVLLRSQGRLLELCGISDYVDRAQLKQQLKAVFVARNWFAHGSCKLTDVKGALNALKEVVQRMACLPTCPPPLAATLHSTAAEVDKLSQRVHKYGACSLSPCCVAFALALRAFERVEAAASAVSGKHFDGFDKVVAELKAWSAAKVCAATLSDKDATVFIAHVDVVATVRNRVFHGTREITASMMDAVHCAAEVLRMLGQGPPSQDLRRSREEFLASFHGGCLASSLPVDAANALCDVARACPFFSDAIEPAHASDGSSCVSAPVMKHVLKGSVRAAGVAPCDCLSRFPRTDIGALTNALKPLCEAMKKVPRFCGLDAVGLRSAAASSVADLLACGKTIVAALPAHRCGAVTFSDDDDGCLRAAHHFIVCKLNHGSYDAACACASGIGAIMRDDCGSTASKDTKMWIKGWHAATDARVALLSAGAVPTKTLLTEADAFLHVVECDMVSRAMAPAACPLSLAVTIQHSDECDVQAFVDRFSGEYLVDRERQIVAAAAVLQADTAGAGVRGGMSAALIYGQPGTGKSHCGDEVLFRLSEVRVQRRCMEKVTCRSAAAVKSGLVQLGRRMGRTLGVGPDTAAADVLDLLKRYLAATPCVLLRACVLILRVPTR